MMIIKANGNIRDISAGLKALSETFGKDATLSEIRRAVRLSRLRTTERKQSELKEIKQ